MTNTRRKRVVWTSETSPQTWRKPFALVLSTDGVLAGQINISYAESALRVQLL
jgi:hypothetical protein